MVRWVNYMLKSMHFNNLMIWAWRKGVGVSQTCKTLIIFFQFVRIRKPLQIIVRLWVSRTRASSWIACIIIWRARVFQNGDFFLHFQTAATSLRHVRIVRFLNGSFFRVHLTSPLNIWRARKKNFFFHFQPFHTATSTMQTGRLT